MRYTTSGNRIRARSNRIALLTLLLAATSLVPHALANEDQRHGTTVALTAAVYAEAGKPQRDTVDVLLALLEAEVSHQPNQSVVERRQIDLALQELAWSADLGTDAQSRLQLGRIVSADLILTLELLKPEEPEQATPRVLIRIVESLTGAIRGVSVVPIEEARLDEAAIQIARYLALVQAEPDQPPLTVAVVPFESRSQFDRLRPLELGLRDMIAARLLRWSHKLTERKGSAEKATKNPQPRGFQVLQRSNMQELLRELDLNQSGLVDRSRLPPTLPTRAAAFLVRGEIDERDDEGELRVIVSGELVRAASNKAVHEFRLETTPKQLEVALAHQVDLLAGRLLASADNVSVTPGPLSELNEVDMLFHRVAADLSRFRRRCPIDFSYRDFELPTNGVATGPPIFRADSPLGRAILKKSIDRLEAILYIHPDRGDAAYALAFCYAFHIDEIGDPKRADELLRRAAGSEPAGRLGADALRLLAEITFHHQTGRVPDGQTLRAFDQMMYAFQNMPYDCRDAMWARLPSAMAPLLSKFGDTTRRMRLVEATVAEAERQDAPHRYTLAMAVNQLSAAAAIDEQRGPDAIATLRRWIDGKDSMLKQTAARGLAQIAGKQGQFAQAARWYRIGADGLSVSTSGFDLRARDNLRVHAARCLRQAGKPDEALELIESFQPQDQTSLNYGYYAVELGQCYMECDENEKALNVMVTAAEHVRGLCDNSRVEQFIEQLGGVPLSEDRDVDVEYIAGPDGKPIYAKSLATDGTTLFTPGPLKNGTRRGVGALDVKRRSWKVLTTAFGEVTSMAVHHGELWVGTAEEGIWRCALSSNHWTRWSMDGGLPDDRVTVLTATVKGVFAGVGTPAAGGVIRIDDDQQVEVVDGTFAPREAPSFLVVQGEQLFAATRSGVHEFSLKEQRWTSVTTASGLQAMRIFPGKTHAWASTYRREIFPYGAGDAEAARYNAAWFDEPDGPAGITILFAIEHRGQLWFGGYPWSRFRSVGFYRIDPQTGEFRIYGLRDGFRMSTTYTTNAAVAIGNDLWLATSAGLARVVLR